MARLAKLRTSQAGIAHLLLVVLLAAVVAVVGFGVYKAVTRQKGSALVGSDGQVVRWSSDGVNWKSSGNPPACPSPLIVQAPTDLSKVTAILYPGQFRGGNYKAHGGFRLDGSSEAVNVMAPMDGYLVNASRYIEQGEQQILLEFINSCGVMFRFDHLLTLTPKFHAAINKLPPAKENDSQTHQVEPVLEVKAGELIATAVGFPKMANISFDFGLYDLRQPNGFTLSEPQDQVGASLNRYGLCWLNNLATEQSNLVKGLPAGDAQSGKTSDYCK